MYFPRLISDREVKGCCIVGQPHSPSPRRAAMVGCLRAHDPSRVCQGTAALTADHMPATVEIDEAVLEDFLRQGGVPTHDAGKAEEL